MKIIIAAAASLAFATSAIAAVPQADVVVPQADAVVPQGRRCRAPGRKEDRSQDGTPGRTGLGTKPQRRCQVEQQGRTGRKRVQRPLSLARGGAGRPEFSRHPVETGTTDPPPPPPQITSASDGKAPPFAVSAGTTDARLPC